MLQEKRKAQLQVLKQAKSNKKECKKELQRAIEQYNIATNLVEEYRNKVEATNKKIFIDKLKSNK